MFVVLIWISLLGSFSMALKGVRGARRVLAPSLKKEVGRVETCRWWIDFLLPGRVRMAAVYPLCVRTLALCLETKGEMESCMVACSFSTMADTPSLFSFFFKSTIIASCSNFRCNYIRWLSRQLNLIASSSITGGELLSYTPKILWVDTNANIKVSSSKPKLQSGSIFYTKIPLLFKNNPI